MEHGTQMPATRLGTYDEQDFSGLKVVFMFPNTLYGMKEPMEIVSISVQQHDGPVRAQKNMCLRLPLWSEVWWGNNDKGGIWYPGQPAKELVG